MDEGYEALTLMQTGKSQLMPLVLIDRPGGTYWRTWDKHVREHLLRDQLISPDDLFLYQITDSTDEAVKIITRFCVSHAMRLAVRIFMRRCTMTCRALRPAAQPVPVRRACPR